MSWKARANKVLKRKGKSKDREDEEAYMRWHSANTIMRIGRARLHDEPQKDPPPQPVTSSPTVPQSWVWRSQYLHSLLCFTLIQFIDSYNGILSICRLQISVFLNHVVWSCDRSIVANVDLIKLITPIKTKVERFMSTFASTYVLTQKLSLCLFIPFQISRGYMKLHPTTIGAATSSIRSCQNYPETTSSFKTAIRRVYVKFWAISILFGLTSLFEQLNMSSWQW